MWISKSVLGELESLRRIISDAQMAMFRWQGENTRLVEENARLLSMNAWFQHRLNQVEMERAMLMQDRIGVKISVPQFVPAMDNAAEALSKTVDISTVGGDAHDDSDSDTQNTGMDYANLPGYSRGKR